MKIKVTYDTGPTTCEIPDADLVELCKRIETRNALHAQQLAEAALAKRVVVKVEVV